MTETERNQHNQQIETLYALYQQASSQRDVLMAQQTQQIEAWKQRSKEAKTEWQGLTDEEIKAFDTWHDNREEEVGWVNPSEIVAYIDAKLRSKNTSC